MQRGLFGLTGISASFVGINCFLEFIKVIDKFPNAKQFSVRQCFFFIFLFTFNHKLKAKERKNHFTIEIETDILRKRKLLS